MGFNISKTEVIFTVTFAKAVIFVKGDIRLYTVFCFITAFAKVTASITVTGPTYR